MRKIRRHISAVESKAMYDLKQSGTKIVEIARIYGIHPTTVGHHCNKHIMFNAKRDAERRPLGYKNEAYYTEDEALKKVSYIAEDLTGEELKIYNDL